MTTTPDSRTALRAHAARTADEVCAAWERTYMGGHHDDHDLEVFRHGMSTGARCTQYTRDALLEALDERDVLRAAVKRVHDETDWCPACDHHEHLESCPLYEDEP